MKTTLNVGGLAGEDVRFWFDEAVRAEFDYELAYDDYLITLLPRWGGNIPAMIRFGHECADSGRYDTQVPLFIDSVVSWLLVEIGSYQTIFRSEDVYRTYQTVLKNYVEHSKNEPSKRYYRSLRACLAWQGQRLGEFRQIATNLGNEFDSRAYRKFQMKPDEVRQALDMLQAPPQGKFPNFDPPPTRLAFAPDGATFWAGTAKGEISQWDFVTGQLVTKLPRNANGLAALIVLEDGGVICVGRDGEARFHDAANPRNSRSLSVEGRVTATALSHDGVKVWQMPADWQTRQTALVSKDTWQMPAAIQSLGFSPNGKLVAAGYGKTQVWDLQTKSKVFELPGQALSFSPDSSWLVTGGGTLAGTATIWDLSNGEPHLRLLGGHDNPISSVLFYNSRYVITGDSAGKLRCWNAGDGKISPDFPQPAAE